MRLILEAIDGPLSGRKIAVDDGDSLTVGRTQRADVALERDAQMSGAHFRLEVLAGVGRIWDLDSLNGTLLNGATVAQATLANEDRITAGESVFHVTLLESEPPPLEADERHTVDRRSQPRGRPVDADAETNDGATAETDAGLDDAEFQDNSPEPDGEMLPQAQVPTLVPNRPLPTQWFVLDLIENEQTVATFDLSARQWTLVGRDEDAHVFLVDDTQLSKRHLCIEVDGDECWALDLASSNGTQVNGDWISATRLHAGDMIVAGQTHLRVRVTDLPAEVEQEQAATMPSQAAGPTQSTSMLLLYGNAPRVRYRMYRCHSGLDFYRGEDSTFDIQQIATRMTNTGGAYLIVTAESMEPLRGVAESVGVELQPLYTQSNAAESSSAVESASGNGPWILGPITAGNEVPDLLMAWTDGVLCLFSEHDLNAIRKHCSRVRSEFAERSPGWTHIWNDPALMADYLANQDPADVARVLDPFVALLLEVHQGDRWAIFSRVLNRQLLRMVGLVSVAD